MSVNDSIIDRYIAIWNETDPAKRRDLVDWTFTEDATYLDPMLSGDGHAGLETMFDGVVGQLPGAQVSLTGEPDIHHDWVRFNWKLVLPGETASFIEGFDVGKIGPDGRFERIVGFLDKVPAAIAS